MTRMPATPPPSGTEAEVITFDESSGNVFADLGFPNPEEHLQKVQLLQRLDALLRERGFTQTQAAHLLGIDQPSLSRLLRGVVRGVSIEKLMQFLARLDQHVLIVVTPRNVESPVVEVDVATASAAAPALVVRVEPSSHGPSARSAVGRPRRAARSSA